MGITISKIKETCIYVKDLEQTKAFYGDKLGLPVISIVLERHIFFRAGASVLLCFIAAQTEKEAVLPPHGASGCIHFAFEVSKADYTATLEIIKQHQITISHEHTWKGELRSFYFSDPDGNLVEIIEEGVWD